MNEPTSDVSTSNQMQSAGSGLERLLNIAIGGYSAVSQAKVARQLSQAELAKANQTGVAPEPAPDSTRISPQVMYAAGAVVVVVLAIALLKK